VVPGLNVDVKSAEANVSPLNIVIDDSTVPMFVTEDERPMVISCVALAIFPLESCNWTKIHLLVLLSASTAGDPVKILSFAGSDVVALEVF